MKKRERVERALEIGLSVRTYSILMASLGKFSIAKDGYTGAAPRKRRCRILPIATDLTAKRCCYGDAAYAYPWSPRPAQCSKSPFATDQTDPDTFGPCFLDRDGEANRCRLKLGDIEPDSDLEAPFNSRFPRMSTKAAKHPGASLAPLKSRKSSIRSLETIYEVDEEHEYDEDGNEYWISGENAQKLGSPTSVASFGSENYESDGIR